MPNMPKGNRTLFSRGKGYLSVAGPQYRFIVFLLVVLGVYTFLMKVFLKLAEIVQFPVFFPIALVTLLLFIGVVGTLYSHTIVGPLLRIRRTLEQLSQGNANVSLRLRDSDDPLLKDIVKTINLLGEHDRNSRALLQESGGDLLRELTTLQEMVRRGADHAELRKQLDGMREKQDLLNKTLQSLSKV